MYWVVEYLNGKTVTEKETNFKSIDKKGMKLLYFMYKGFPIGINLINGLFFINKKQFDFKIGNGEYFPLQFKKAFIKLELNGTQTTETNHNIGCYMLKLNYKFKYYFSISDNGVFLHAEKEDLSGNLIDSRKLQIQ